MQSKDLLTVTASFVIYNKNYDYTKQILRLRYATLRMTCLFFHLNSQRQFIHNFRHRQLLNFVQLAYNRTALT